MSFLLGRPPDLCYVRFLGVQSNGVQLPLLELWSLYILFRCQEKGPHQLPLRGARKKNGSVMCKWFGLVQWLVIVGTSGLYQSYPSVSNSMGKDTNILISSVHRFQLSPGTGIAMARSNAWTSHWNQWNHRTCQTSVIHMGFRENFWLNHMGVSKNNGTSKSSILIGFSIVNHPFWGTPFFGNTHIGEKAQRVVRKSSTVVCVIGWGWNIWKENFPKKCHHFFLT